MTWCAVEGAKRVLSNTITVCFCWGEHPKTPIARAMLGGDSRALPRWSSLGAWPLGEGLEARRPAPQLAVLNRPSLQDRPRLFPPTVSHRISTLEADVSL